MFLLYRAFGTLDFGTINAAFAQRRRARRGGEPGRLLLFIGAAGKSAQIPLYVWLPDAMAGPTPVSALIHAATMVTAGVYLMARLTGLFLHAPDALQASSRGRRAHRAVRGDHRAGAERHQEGAGLLHRVAARLHVPGAGRRCLRRGIFHLYTHAFFKACLFLGAGSVIHALSGEQDIRKMGGLARKIPVTFVDLPARDRSRSPASRRSPASSPRTRSSGSRSPATHGGSPVLWPVLAATAL